MLRGVRGDDLQRPVTPDGCDGKKKPSFRYTTSPRRSHVIAISTLLALSYFLIAHYIFQQTDRKFTLDVRTVSELPDDECDGFHLKSPISHPSQVRKRPLFTIPLFFLVKSTEFVRFHKNEPKVKSQLHKTTITDPTATESGHNSTCRSKFSIDRATRVKECRF